VSVAAAAAAAVPVIIDAQVSLASQLVTPREFIEYQAWNAYHRLAAYGYPVSKERITGHYLSLYTDDEGDRLVAEMDAAGVDQAFLVAADYSQAATCALAPPELAALHARVCQRHPGRFRVFWGADPRSGADGLALFSHCVTEYGFAGLKLYPLCGYSPSDRGLYPYFTLCDEYRLPVLSHTGPGWGPLEFGYGDPLLIDTAARDFPRVNFILGHGGVSCVDVAKDLCAHRPNVYMDISMFHSVLSPDGWQAHLARLFRSGISHKILFGTCWPSYCMSVSLPQLVREFKPGGAAVAGLKEPERKLIMSGNSLRLLGASVNKERTVGHGAGYDGPRTGSGRVGPAVERGRNGG
jgi:uncharacterized protein